MLWAAVQVVALDFAQEMLDYAETRQGEQQRPGRIPSADIEWVLGDATNLPFPDQRFSAATMGYGLRNVSSQNAQSAVPTN